MWLYQRLESLRHPGDWLVIRNLLYSRTSSHYTASQSHLSSKRYVTLSAAFPDPRQISLTPLWFRPSYRSLLQGITACGFASFMFGWHVHEKAVMLILVPLRWAGATSAGEHADSTSSLLATEDWNHYQAFVVASISGLISLFPLLFHAAGEWCNIVSDRCR